MKIELLFLAHLKKKIFFYTISYIALKSYKKEIKYQYSLPKLFKFIYYSPPTLEYEN